MGIYIKDMEMPFTCLSCYFHKCAGGIGDFCALAKKKQSRFKNRPSYCPLFPVPPHGRLIDADKIPYKKIMLDDNEFYYGVTQPYIDRMPTIIPAEDGE